ncbi:MAG: protein kinase [Myxococcota bacterium]|nr:protein kinase [Myxococcota bacterium]MDW8360752.1 protein kinase [Myxococcales bacterium]
MLPTAWARAPRYIVSDVERIGRYRIVRRLATGGMAEVLLAREQGFDGLERTVVLKRILPVYAGNEEFVTMFLDEARLMAALSHPNIAHVLDFGSIDDTHFLVMEYVRGPTLSDLLQAGAERGTPALPESIALPIGLAIAEALAYVHTLRDEHGRPLRVVHRDLNPANVMVSYEGAVKLIDFGIAKAATKVYETRTGVIKGTYGYIAPEQLSRTAPVDHRADLFALGVLLYEMCVGQHPYDTSDEPDPLHRVLSARYQRPRRIAPSFPRDLDRLIASCLAPHPDGRPADMHAVIEALVEAMASRRIVPTMSAIARFVAEWVPDREGAAPLPVLPHHAPAGPFEIDPARLEALPRALPDVEDPSVEPRRDDPDGSGSPTQRRDAVDGQVLAAIRPILPPPSSRNRAWRTAASALALLVAAVGGWAVVRALGSERAPFAPNPGPSVQPSGREAPGRTARESIGTDASSATHTDAPVSTTLHVLSEPSGARVYVDGEETGAVTPVTLNLPNRPERVLLRLVLEGHHPQQREVLVTAGEARFVLVPVAHDAGLDAMTEPADAGPLAGPRRRGPRIRRR